LKRWRILFFLLFNISFFHVCVKAQTAPDLYAIYEKQFIDLLTVRGLSEIDIQKLLLSYSENKLNSDQDLALFLEKIYSNQRDIGILFYFFKNDSLRRAYFKPGQIVDVKTIAIQKETLLQLGANINNSLGLYQNSYSRMPRERGSKLINKSSNFIPFEDAIEYATDILIPDVLDTNTKHLLIIPALNIGTIPFHLLKPFSDGRYLIDKCSFTIIPSLIDLVALRTRILRNINHQRLDISLPFDANSVYSQIDSLAFDSLSPSLFIGNPRYPNDSNFVFPDLPGAEREIDSANRYLKNNVMLKGSEATKVNVYKHIHKVDLIYFATHGVSDQDDPMGKSFLVLSGHSPYLTAKEIMGMMDSKLKLPELVILSACQTGLGKSMEAGTAGLARSFLIGGSNHVIMSLWNVDDEATSYLMSRFIFHMLKPHRYWPSEPLRQAVLDTKKIYKNPSQWASFSLFGIDY